MKRGRAFSSSRRFLFLLPWLLLHWGVSLGHTGLSQVIEKGAGHCFFAVGGETGDRIDAFC